MANLVLNPGFETGTLPPWIGAGGASVNIVINPVHSGTYAAAIIGTEGTLTQSGILTTPLNNYTLSFWATGGFGGSPQLIIIINGVSHIRQLLPFYQLFTIPFSTTALDLTTTLVFENSITVGSTVVIDDVSIVAAAVCFSGKSKVLTKNKLTDEISDICADAVISDVHCVFSTKKQEFVPIKYNIITGPVKKFMLIKKDSIDQDQPTENFYVTSGHKIMINDVELKVKNIPQAKKITVEPEYVYTICTDEREPILVNGLNVMTYGYDEWMHYAEEKSLVWRNNAL